MTSSLSPKDALERYSKALHDLGPTDPAITTPIAERVLETLLARDAAQACLEEAESISASSLLLLNKLDDRFAEQQKTLASLDAIAKWRKVRNPPQSAWWWYPEPPALLPCLEHRWNWLDQFDWLWALLSLFCLTVAVTFVLNTLNRVLAGGIDTQGLFAVVLQTVLTLTGGVVALTQQGRQTLETLLTRCRIPRHYWQELSVLLSLLLLLVVIGIHELYLPRLAADLSQQGLTYYEKGRLDSALSAYQQSIALRPDNPEVYYSLGVLYEDLQEPDKAIAQYQLVVQSEPPPEPASQERLIFLRANNNLGRLYLLQDKPKEAWISLERGLGLVDANVVKTNPDFRYEHYNLLKNLGWARLQQKNYADAANYLQQASELDNQRAAAYCLQAQVLEAQKQNTDAAWESCVQYAKLSNADEALWIGMAREHFAQPETPPTATPRATP